MRIDLKEFIEKYKDDINRNLFKKIYFLAIFGELSSPNIGKFTELLYKCGIDPLEHMPSVPTRYAYGSSLKDIKIPDNITSIGEWAFSYCDDLVSITIPNSVTSIGYAAFKYCRSLKTISYEGNKEQWDSIITFSDWNGQTPLKTVHCRDGIINV